MAKLNKGLLSSKKFTNELSRIIQEGDLGELTASKIRKELEDIFELDRNSLKEKPYKDILNTMIDEYARHTEEENGTSDGTKDDQDENDEPMTEITNDDDDKEMKEESPAPKESTDDTMKEEEEDNDKALSDSENSDAPPSPPPQKKQRQKKAPSTKPKSTEKKGTINKTLQDDEAIKRWKSYINKCGVRKVWQKELAGFTTKKSQIAHLKKILQELGVEGRPTIEKCETIKAERELKAEIDSLDKDNILEAVDDRPSLRSSGLSKRKRRPVIQEDSDESGDDDTGGALDVSFLGNQSDDSD